MQGYHSGLLRVAALLFIGLVSMSPSAFAEGDEAQASEPASTSEASTASTTESTTESSVPGNGNAYGYGNGSGVGPPTQGCRPACF